VFLVKNKVVNKFRAITNFKGTVSIIGHSLGSIISWDILATQPDDEVESILVDESPLSVSFPSVTVGSTMPKKATIASPFGSSDSLGTNIDNYNTTSTGSPRLCFPVSNFFMLGSPVAVFLMIRNQRMPLTDDYYLPGCRNVYNIFHPYDPVAYRIEPCIDPRNYDTAPSIIRHWNGGYRMHYQTRRMWQKLVETTRKTQNEFVGAFEEKMTRIGLLGGGTSGGVAGTTAGTVSMASSLVPRIKEVDSSNDDSASEMSGMDNNISNQFGMLNRGMRIDYMLQESEIETANEYVAALAAHSSYWPEKDLSLFIATQITQ
jgi:DDHD domain